MKRNGNLLPMIFDDFFNRDVFDWNNVSFEVRITWGAGVMKRFSVDRL